MHTNSLLELDGSKFRAEKETVKLVNVPKSIADFLSKTNTSMVLVGQKGTGKSILLSYKKFNELQRTDDGKTFIFPKSTGVEEINFDGEFGVKALSPFTIENWEKIFTISIQYYLFCQLKNLIIESGFLKDDQFDELQIHKQLNPFSLDVGLLQFGNILDSAISNRICYMDLRDFTGLARNILVSGIIDKNKNNIFYFLDGLDQALYKAIQRSDSSNLTAEKEIENILGFENSLLRNEYERTREENKVHLWIKAQLGFLKSLHYLNELNRSNLKIYGSIRYEAYVMMEHFDLRNLPQLKSTCKVISYSNDELIQIFRTLLTTAGIEKHHLKQYGIVELIHNKVRNETFNKETIEQHVLRHTFGNPREITYQILALKSLFNNKEQLSDNDPEKNTSVLKEYLSRIIKEIKIDLQTETLPAFPSNGLKKLLAKYRANYIPNSKVEEGEEKQLITILYKLGLIGVLKWESENTFKQHFLEKNIYFVHTHDTLPDSPFYLLHPVLDPLLFEDYGHDEFYYPHCIIGHGLPFVSLREVEYYIPANLLKENLSGDRVETKKLFVKFWNGKNSMDRYRAIYDTFNNEWASKIISDYLFGTKAAIPLKQTLYGKLDSSTYLTIDNTVRYDNDLLRRNYKLRMIVALSLATKFFGKKEIEQLYASNRKFTQRSFFVNIRNKNLNLERVLKQLSSFERDCIKDALTQFNKKHLNQINVTEGAKERFSKINTIFLS